MISSEPLATADVVIVGAGIAGLCTAFELRKRGFDVAVVEQRFPAFGGSGRNPGALWLQLQRGGRHRHLFFWCQQLVVQLLRNADEMPRRLARGRAIAGHGLLRRTE